MSEQNSSLLIIAAIITLLPGAYFAWKIVQGIILSLTRGKDDDL